MNRRKFLHTVPAVFAAPLHAQSPPARKPNVVVFLVDDMGYADVGCYGAKDIKTPNVDRLAREGVRFTDFYSNGPVCTPTRVALMTGRYQQRVGLEWALVPANTGKGLPVKETSLARIFKDAGYRTALFGKWHLGAEPEYGPNAHGFDRFFGILGGNVDHYSHRIRDGRPDLWENTNPVQSKGYLTDQIASRAVSWIGEQARDPFFLYVAFNAVHWPFQPPKRENDVRGPETWTDGNRADYARMVESVDAAVGQVLNELDQRGLARDTLVAFTNDNGGERYSDNQPLFHHKATLWEGGIRVPAILRWPGQIPAGKVTRQPAMTMDLMPTVLSAVGVRPPAGRSLDGIDLLPVIRDGKPNVERTFFWRIDRADRKQKAVRKGNWKYIQDGAIEMLFDLEKDPGERVDLGVPAPRQVAALRQEMLAWEKKLALDPPPFVVR